MENKWLMINIQNVQDFACQCLNRDVWSNDAVKTIIREHFIFWQVCCLRARGRIWSLMISRPSPGQPTGWRGKVGIITKRRCNTFFFSNKWWCFSSCFYCRKKLFEIPFLAWFLKAKYTLFFPCVSLHLPCVEPFISLQVYHDSEEGQRYIQFYKLNKFPYISILDPRTGECSCELR